MYNQIMNFKVSVIKQMLCNKMTFGTAALHIEHFTLFNIERGYK